MLRALGKILLACGVLAVNSPSIAGVTPEMQHAIREATFEVVLKRPEKDPLSYEKPLPLELMPYIERTDAYKSIGTAFALGHNQFVTAKHVIIAGINSQFGPPALRGTDGTVYAINRILKFSAHEDFVVFSLVGDPAREGFATATSPQIDDPVLAVGNALGEGVVIRDGLLTSETAEAQDGRWKWLRFSAAASPGNSGGPLLDAAGKVIGIVIGKSPSENLNYALPIARVLADTSSKARFDERFVTRLPLLQGSNTYILKEDFDLPRTWPEFCKAYEATGARYFAAAQAQFLSARRETLFPEGRGTEALLYATDANDTLPWLAAQEPDDTWHALKPTYVTTSLTGDGSVRVGTAQAIQLLRLVRPDRATDEAFYHDSRAFMDLALKGLNIQRIVGADQVRITSLGSATDERQHVDRYGRGWQVRAWPLPYLDMWVLAALLPTPDGYAGIVQLAPSQFLFETRELLYVLTDLVEVSYQGTLPQWHAFLGRRALLPTALAELRLSDAPQWSLRGKRFEMKVPASLFALDNNSLLKLSMTYIWDGPRVVWDIGEAWWYHDNEEKIALGLWRRAKPPETSNLELRNRYADMLARKNPFNWEMTRTGNETYALSTILDVPGNSAGTRSADLLYGITLQLDNPRPGRLNSELQSLSTAAAHVTEHGHGAELAAATFALSAPPARVQSSTGYLDKQSNRILDWATRMEITDVSDVRNRRIADDVSDYLTLAADVGARGTSGATDAEARANYLEKYWQLVRPVNKNRELWTGFLSKNGLPPDTPHAPEVREAESNLKTTLAKPPSAEWSTSAAALIGAYIGERESSVRHLPSAIDVIYQPRQSACPAQASRSSGKSQPAANAAGSSLSEFYPPELRRDIIAGSVILAVRVAANGCAVQVGVAGSSGTDSMDLAALRWAETAEFLPAELDGKMVDGEMKLAVRFKLGP